LMVMTSAHPPMLYDYGGFPEFTYHIKYPAPGSPEVAVRVQQLLAAFDVRADDRRGFDHGVFAPFYAMYPEANVPILQLSLADSYDPALHLAVGRALKPLRDENVLIVGSGLSYHNLRLMGPRAQEPSQRFDTWLTDALTKHTGAERSRLLEAWSEAPAARVCHPQEDHLIPLMVAAGAAEDDNAERIYHEDAFFGGVHTSSYRFGVPTA
jgi:aromatic ring-opening dioxygenase catalytic subunit (LigB family)